jgi:hypothetical protein
MSNYTFPDLSNHKIIYKGRRYIAFEVNQSNPFESMEDYADFVVWDGEYDAAVSYGTINAKGGFDGFLAFSHVEIEIDSAENIRDFVKNSSKAQMQFFKDSGN